MTTDTKIAGVTETYLGDSVYVRYQKGYPEITLYLNNGRGEHSHMVLEGEVALALQKVLKELLG